MHVKTRSWEIPSSEITDERLYRDRRSFLKDAGTLLAASAAGSLPWLQPAEAFGAAAAPKKGPYDTDEPRNSYEDITTYNNFYEFGTDKDDPARNAGTLKTRPWTVSVEGLVKQPKTYDLDALIKPYKPEERVYRMRCVEGWSMVIPWLGFPLASLIRTLEPLPSAKFVEFKTLYAPGQMPGQNRAILNWPYTEGLRMDEATNPLTFMVTGVYGKPVPNQNGAPLRLVIPWKYGFKGIKSIVKIRFVDKQPHTAWVASAPDEYGFYANVNPNVDHPRWSQARERRLGEIFKRKTLMFNGYTEHVAQMYSGMDLKRNY
jgi:sulfoxide reductase catalytic subunit YedY